MLGSGSEASDVQRTATAGAIQTKLAINKPGDKYEQEADQVADQVIARPTHSKPGNAPPHIQRFTSSHTTNTQTETAPASVDRALANPGKPLESSLRQDMEQHFSQDFSQVRVHTDATAEQSAQDVNANAFTVGHNVVFGAGRFAPGTHEGRHLLTHELAHTVQQSRGAPLSIAREPKDQSFAVNQQDMVHLQNTMLRFYNLLGPDARASLQRNTTVVIALITHGNQPTLVYTVAGNSINPAIRAAADQLGLARWDPEGITKTAGEHHAEKLTFEAASKLGFRVHGMAVTREPCGDCGPVVAEKGVPIVWVRDPNPAPRTPPPDPGKSTTSQRNTPTGKSAQATVPASGGGVSSQASHKAAAPSTAGVPAKPPTSTTPPARTDSGAKGPSSIGATPAKQQPKTFETVDPAPTVFEGGPSPRGEGKVAGITLGLDLAHWILGKVNAWEDGQRLNQRWEEERKKLQIVQQEHPELGALLILRYEIIHRSNEGETVSRFRSLSVIYGTTERSARNSSPDYISQGETVTETRWLPPPEPSLEKMDTGFRTLAIGTFAKTTLPYQAVLQNVSYGGYWSNFNKEGTETINIPEAVHPRFAILMPPESVYANGMIESWDVSSETTSDGFLVPVVSDLHAVLAFPLNSQTADIFAQGKPLSKGNSRFGHDFDLTRWIPIKNVEIERAIDNEVKLSLEKVNELKEQKEFEEMGRAAMEWHQRMRQGNDPFARSLREADAEAAARSEQAQKSLEWNKIQGRWQRREPPPVGDVLTFSRTGKEVTLGDLISWTRIHHPEELNDRTFLPDLRNYLRLEITGSENARNRMEALLLGYLREF
jgi:hypothetical protein